LNSGRSFSSWARSDLFNYLILLSQPEKYTVNSSHYLNFKLRADDFINTHKISSNVDRFFLSRQNRLLSLNICKFLYVTNEDSLDTIKSATAQKTELPRKKYRNSRIVS